MLNRLRRTEFQVLKRTVSSIDAGGSVRTLYVPSEPLWGVLSAVSSNDSELAYSDVLQRQKRIRCFSKISVAYNDRIRINGEDWQIVGEPETISSSSSRRRISTVIVIQKEGKQ